MPYINLVGYTIPFNVLIIIPEEQAKTNRLVAYNKVGNSVRVATDQPENPNLKNLFQVIKDSTGLDAVLSLCSKSSIDYALKMYAVLPAEEAKTKEKVIVGEAEKAAFEAEIKTLADLKEKIKQIPATRLLDVIFAGAVKGGASDIHLEPQETNLRIRYRIDGVLQDVVQLPADAFKALRSRIKYLAKLKLDITDRPQDGRFDAEAAGEKIDIRVSTIPGAYGELIAMRLLLHEKKFLNLGDLGFRPEAIKIIEDAVKKTNGIIFNTGPTGSGKTTTLYAILGKLNKPGIKIMTLEDPIEYRIVGVDQSQVEPEKGYDFANGLRSVLRQDPDIIMVGEIRDSETGGTAIQAAITGHLVLTTLHTSSAAAALPRLIDMGVPPYLLAGAVNLIIAQRLVRKICPTCKGAGFIIENNEKKTCPTCSGFKFKGRIGIIETLIPNKEIENLIIRKATISEFEEAAKKSGMKTMLRDGLEKVKAGLTTEEEVRRVVSE